MDISASKSFKISGSAPAFLEISGLAGLAALTIFFLLTSWRKWPDPLVDFGRELYIPWRITQGAVLYRDVDDMYGPLSHYFNAALFAVFGPGLMILVAANLVIYLGILAAIYLLFRQAWGVGAALAATVIFVAVFSFSQFVGVGNYNYATPYSHETTHGLLVCLLLVHVLLRWIENPALGRSFTAGLLFGLTAVLKPEIMLAAGLVTVTAMLISGKYGKRWGLTTAVAWMGGAVLPTLGFTVYFSTVLPWNEAVQAACHGWLSVTTSTRLTTDGLQLGFLGLDQPWEHLKQHALATLEAFGLIGGIATAACLTERTAQVWMRVLVMVLLVIPMSWLACAGIDWIKIGRCLLGVMLVYTAFRAFALFREKEDKVSTVRLLLAVLATALMLRMFLNGRIYQYGYYQAALAGILMPAVLIGELPGWLGAGRWGTWTAVIGTVALLMPGVVILAHDSQQNLSLKTQPIGKGVDQFYAFSNDFDPKGGTVSFISEALQKMPLHQTLLVLPQGVMLNYLARQASPVAPFYFYAGAIAEGREDKIVDELKATPPDSVVIISCPLSQYGIQRYGDGPDHGQQLLNWVHENYSVSDSVGGDPLDQSQFGGTILKRKN